jgi:hypothetical protein
VLKLCAEPRGHRFSLLCGDRVQSPTIQLNDDDDDCVIVEQPLTSDDAEEAPGPQVLSARKLAMRSGRTPEPTIGGGDCLFQAITSEAQRVGLLSGKPRNLANTFWRRAAADCARQDFVQRLMTDHPQGEWRFGRSQAAPQAASYPGFILAPGRWAGTFDVALLAWCINNMQSHLRPDVRSRLVVIDGRDGVHVHHPVGTNGKLCQKTKLFRRELRELDVCVAIDGCHWFSCPPSNT